MAILKVLLTSEGVIDNASIYLEDPDESIEYKLDPGEDGEWATDVSIPIVDGPLDYSLYVVAFSGTAFTCTITKDGKESIKLDGITGQPVRGRAHLVGTAEFE